MINMPTKQQHRDGIAATIKAMINGRELFFAGAAGVEAIFLSFGLPA
jgi:hypothetical protein